MHSPFPVRLNWAVFARMMHSNYTIRRDICMQVCACVSKDGPSTNACSPKQLRWFHPAAWYVRAVDGIWWRVAQVPVVHPHIEQCRQTRKWRSRVGDESWAGKEDRRRSRQVYDCFLGVHGSRKMQGSPRRSWNPGHIHGSMHYPKISISSI